MIIVNVGPVESDTKAGLKKALSVGGRATDNLGSPADMAADVACTGAILEVPGSFNTLEGGIPYKGSQDTTDSGMVLGVLRDDMIGEGREDRDEMDEGVGNWEKLLTIDLVLCSNDLLGTSDPRDMAEDGTYITGVLFCTLCTYAAELPLSV